MTTRHEIEAKIQALGQKIDETSINQDCFDPDAVREFLNAWLDLASYFNQNPDREIGVLVVHEYRKQLNFFYELMGRTQSLTCRRQIQEAIGDLESSMDHIIECVESNTTFS